MDEKQLREWVSFFGPVLAPLGVIVFARVVFKIYAAVAKMREDEYWRREWKECARFQYSSRPRRAWAVWSPGWLRSHYRTFTKRSRVILNNRLRSISEGI